MRDVLHQRLRAHAGGASLVRELDALEIPLDGGGANGAKAANGAAGATDAAP
jgi:hypothetical protein